MANTVTLSNGHTQATSSPTSVVVGKDTSSLRGEDTPIIGPRQPPSRHAASACARRSSEGTSTSTRPARSSSALRTATLVFPDPVAMMSRSGFSDQWVVGWFGLIS